MKHTTSMKIYLQEGLTKHDPVIPLLDGHFLPQNNITYERYVFQNVQQNVDENIH